MSSKVTTHRRVVSRRRPAASSASEPRLTRARLHRRRTGGYGAAGTVGQVLGGTAGAVYGQPYAGSLVGQSIAKGLNMRLRGRGDYSISGGSIMNEDIVSLPRFAKSDSDIIISKCEFVGDVLAGSGTPTVFNEQLYFGNPGLNTTNQSGSFNWLSNIANAWESYEFLQLVFHYQPTSGNATGANTALGQVVIAASYSPSTWQNNNGFGTKQAMLDAQFATTGPPSKFMMMPVECKRSEQNFKFHSTRSGPLSANQNIDIFDMFGLSVATTGCQTANQPLGELYVSYTIRLSKTQSNPVASGVSAHYTSSDVTPANDWTAGHPLGTGSFPLVQRTGSNLPVTFDYNANTIKMPPHLTQGTFMITMNWQGNSTVHVSPPTITYTNAATVAAFGNANTPYAQAGIIQRTTLDADTNCALTQVFALTGANAVLTFNTDALFPATLTWADISIIGLSTPNFGVFL